MKPSIIRRIRERALNRCEYCQVGQEFEKTTHEVDHVISRKHGGPSTLANLALSCAHAETGSLANRGEHPARRRVQRFQTIQSIDE